MTAKEIEAGYFKVEYDQEEKKSKYSATEDVFESLQTDAASASAADEIKKAYQDAKKTIQRK